MKEGNHGTEKVDIRSVVADRRRSDLAARKIGQYPILEFVGADSHLAVPAHRGGIGYDVETLLEIHFLCIGCDHRWRPGTGNRLRSEIWME